MNPFDSTIVLSLTNSSIYVGAVGAPIEDGLRIEVSASYVEWSPHFEDLFLAVIDDKDRGSCVHVYDYQREDPLIMRRCHHE